MLKAKVQAIFLVVVLLSSSSVSFAQTQKRVVGRPKSNKPPTEKPVATVPKAEIIIPPFTTDGLTSAKFFQYVFDGRFNRLEENEAEFKAAFISYVPRFSDTCREALPADRVELTYLQESYSTQTLNLFGGRGRLLGSFSTRTLKDSRVVGTGVYAEPRFATAHKAVMQEVGMNLSRGMLQSMGVNTGSKVIKIEDLVKFAATMPGDFDLLFQRHGCQSAVVRRIGENLLRFATKQPSIQAENGEMTFFEKECRKQLPGILPNAKVEGCQCVFAELKSSVPLWRLNGLEDKFDADTFFVTAFLHSGLHEKISACLR